MGWSLQRLRARYYVAHGVMCDESLSTVAVHILQCPFVFVACRLLYHRY